MRRVELHPQAYAELDQAISWYENQTRGLGDALLDEVEHAISVIQESPDRWPVYIGETRSFLVHRFPFAIVYRHDDVKIQVLAIAHLRRRPGYWRDRKF
ncbi:MAG: type II toxin-antitoxin system RelE/ParE family toxin [bacterium]